RAGAELPLFAFGELLGGFTCGGRGREPRLGGTYRLKRIPHLGFDDVLGLFGKVSQTVGFDQSSAEIRFCGSISERQRDRNAGSIRRKILAEQIAERIEISADKVARNRARRGSGRKHRQAEYLRKLIDARRQGRRCRRSRRSFAARKSGHRVRTVNV